MDYIQLFGIKWTPLTDVGRGLFALVFVGLVAVMAMAKAIDKIWPMWGGE